MRASKGVHKEMETDDLVDVHGNVVIPTSRGTVLLDRKEWYLTTKQSFVVVVCLLELNFGVIMMVRNQSPGGVTGCCLPRNASTVGWWRELPLPCVCI